MKNYCFDTFNNPTLKFVDRTEIRKIIMDECEHKMQKSDYFKVIAIYGIGGIGKTKLIEKIKETINRSQYNRKLLHISFEIDKNHQVLDNLIKIRKAFGKRCCLFDYTLLIYWDRNRSERLNNDFMDSLKHNFSIDLIDMLSNIVDAILPFYLPHLSIPSLPSLSDIFDFVNELIGKIPDNHYKHILQDIPGCSDVELLDNMPIFLGMDILYQIEKKV